MLACLVRILLGRTPAACARAVKSVTFCLRLIFCMRLLLCRQLQPSVPEARLGLASLLVRVV
jgi:hypothetical protein